MARFNVLPVYRDGDTETFKVLDRRTGKEVTTNDTSGIARNGFLFKWMAEKIAIRLNGDLKEWAHWYGVEE